MTPKHRFFGRRKLNASIAAGVAAITLAIGGGYAVANSSSSNGASASTNTTAAKVVPFQKGQPGLSKSVGQVPAAFKAGSGTIVTGTAADKAKAAALAAYPGGTINRVVLLSDGQYNVHMIGVNWPHHVLVISTFTVVGAQ
jgi:hypothetical protein